MHIKFYFYFLKMCLMGSIVQFVHICVGIYWSEYPNVKPYDIYIYNAGGAFICVPYYNSICFGVRIRPRNAMMVMRRAGSTTRNAMKFHTLNGIVAV